MLASLAAAVSDSARHNNLADKYDCAKASSEVVIAETLYQDGRWPAS